MKITMNNKLFATLIMCILVIGASAPSHTKKKLTEAEAIQAAEKFIADNGYTDLPTMADKTKLAYESIEWRPSKEEMLKRRHNTLKRKAYGLCYEGRSMKPGWTIVFQYKEYSDDHGRAVTMDLNGENKRVEHKDFILSKVDKKL